VSIKNIQILYSYIIEMDEKKYNYDDLDPNLQWYIGQLTQVPENDVNYQIDYRDIQNYDDRISTRNYLYNIDDDINRGTGIPYTGTLGLTVERALSKLNNKEGLNREEREQQLETIKRAFLRRAEQGQLISRTNEDLRKKRLFEDLFGERTLNIEVNNDDIHGGVDWDIEELNRPLTEEERKKAFENYFDRTIKKIEPRGKKIGDWSINRPDINTNLIEMGNRPLPQPSLLERFRNIFF